MAGDSLMNMYLMSLASACGTDAGETDGCAECAVF